ncbi:MAG: hypothetical protein Q8936_06550 [Bacillota bacterium]|nr:hypothetical protein [Bacillota bacterium]
MQRDKLKYIKDKGFIEFDKDQMIKELTEKGTFSEEKIRELVSRYKYYIIMSNGNKMFYSADYIENHTIEEIEASFKKIN